jgi:hypothetical protein
MVTVKNEIEVEINQFIDQGNYVLIILPLDNLIFSLHDILSQKIWLG